MTIFELGFKFNKSHWRSLNMWRVRLITCNPCRWNYMTKNIWMGNMVASRQRNPHLDLKTQCKKWWSERKFKWEMVQSRCRNHPVAKDQYEVMYWVMRKGEMMVLLIACISVPYILPNRWRQKTFRIRLCCQRAVASFCIHLLCALTRPFKASAKVGEKDCKGR